MVITFKTHEDRMQHPQAKRIPESMWSDISLFDGSLDERILPLMKVGIEELPEPLSLRGTKSQKKIIWLAIALGHPDLGLASLRNIASSFGLSENNLFFSLLIFLGNKTYLETFVDELPNPNNIKDLIADNWFDCYRSAASHGHLEILKYLEEKAPDKIEAMIAANNFYAYQGAAQYGHLEILNHLEEKAPDKIEAMIAANTFSAYQLTAQYDHLEVLKHLEEKAPKKIHAMVAANDFYAYQLAAKNGHLQLLKHLEEKAPDEIQAMIAANNFSAYWLAAAEGHLEVLKHLEEKAPDKIQAMIAANDFYAYRGACQKGHLEILKHLEEKAPTKTQKMIETDNFYAYRGAAAQGHLQVLKYFEEKAPKKIHAMVAAKDFSGYQDAAANGHPEILKHLEEKAPDEIEEMMAANDYCAYRLAAGYGHLEVLKHLEEKALDPIQTMVSAGNFLAYRLAAEQGHLEVLKHLEEKAPDQLQAMIEADSFFAYRWSAEYGDIEILSHLEEKAPDQLQAMIAANNFYAYRWAWENNHLAIAQRMLSQSSECFSYAERHAEYSEQITAFIQEMLANLRQLAAATPAQEVFDIADSEQAKICFYIMRHSIRLNDRTYDDELRFLLDIPAVRALAHQAVAGQANELLRLALNQNNEQAATLLLSVPAVRELAEQHNYYRAEMRGGLDLAQLARDRESAMTALTKGEGQRLQEALKHYQPLLDKEGVSPLMNKLRQELRERYEANPALIHDQQGKIITLPMDFEKLQEAKLNFEIYNKALKAYYQHKDHSAWRYLAKPNPWMAPHASYVYVNNNRTERWSTFEEYQPLITLFWVAARDVQIPPTDGHTLKSRVDHFINQLALIGRAHNWDNTRSNSQGNKEEYDDLSGDRPSCFSGVKRRLFQSVLGHPLLTILTKDGLLEEVRTFVRDYFKTQINPHTTIPLKKAFEDYFVNINDLSEDSKTILASFNIANEKQQEFKDYLIQKYGAQYAEDANLRKLVADSFVLKADAKEISDHYHALKFDGLAGLHAILLKVSSPQMPRPGFFQGRDNEPDMPENEQDMREEAASSLRRAE